MEIIDNFVTEKDFELLKKDKYTFFVLGRILHGNCNFIASNHKSFIICHKCESWLYLLLQDHLHYI